MPTHPSSWSERKNKGFQRVKADEFLENTIDCQKFKLWDKCSNLWNQSCIFPKIHLKSHYKIIWSRNKSWTKNSSRFNVNDKSSLFRPKFSFNEFSFRIHWLCYTLRLGGVGSRGLVDTLRNGVKKPFSMTGPRFWRSAPCHLAPTQLCSGARAPWPPPGSFTLLAAPRRCGRPGPGCGCGGRPGYRAALLTQTSTHSWKRNK